MQELTTHEEELVTRTFAEIAPQVDTATQMFYDRLFEVMPSTKNMFGTGEQRFEMFNILATAVKSLSYSGKAGPDLDALGARHVTYGVTVEQFEVVGQVLIWTFKEILGNDFTPEAAATWEKVYGLLRDRVIQGNYTKPDQATPEADPKTPQHTGKLDSSVSEKSAPHTGDAGQQDRNGTKPLVNKPE